MIKITAETMQLIEYAELLRTHEKRAKKAIIKEKVKEYMAEGIDRITAETMAKVFYEYEI